MTRKLYKKIDGEYRWIDLDEPAKESPFFVHQDSMDALTHPVTGEVFESKSAYLKDLKARGLEVVGTEKVRRKKPERITEQKILDAIEKAENIHSDPFKRNQFRRKNEILTELAKKLLYGER